MKVGLVLGAGGVTGGAYIAGALAALENDLGWDARTADVIVGTSAGSVMGAMLRAGIPASDLAAWSVGAHLSDDGVHLLDAVDHPQFDPISIRQFLRMPRAPHAREVWRAIRHPFHTDPMRALLTHLADGTHTLMPELDVIGDEWPESPFYCCAVRRRDGKRTVFGTTRAPDAGLRAAIAASCAVPGYFAPVAIDTELYLDGGIASATNADVLKGEDLDLVIALSPMSTSSHRAGNGLERFVRRQAGAKVRNELAMLERGGTNTVVLEPGPRTLPHLSADFMSDAAAPAIVLSAFVETGEAIPANPELGALSPSSVDAA